MGRYAQIQDYKVVAIVNLETNEELQTLAAHSQQVLDASAAVQVGWIFNGISLVPPPGADPISVIETQVLDPAIEFAARITSRFTAENIAMGVTQAGKTEMIGEALKDLSFWLGSGSIYVALAKLQTLKASIDPAWSPFITLPRLVSFENQIRTYLGLPTI